MQGNKSRHEILRSITEQDIFILPGFSAKAADLLRGLLSRNPVNRFGIEEIKAHAFFESIDWVKLEARQVTPPYVPPVRGADDTRNIDTDFTNEAPAETLQENTHLLKTTNIDDFTYQGDPGFLDR